MDTVFSPQSELEQQQQFIYSGGFAGGGAGSTAVPPTGQLKASNSQHGLFAGLGARTAGPAGPFQFKAEAEEEEIQMKAAPDTGGPFTYDGGDEGNPGEGSGNGSPFNPGGGGAALPPDGNGIQPFQMKLDPGASVIQRDEDDDVSDADFAPQDPSQAGDIPDLTTDECGGVSDAGIGQIAHFLNIAHTELDNWESWRNHENWSLPTIQETIPSMNSLISAFNTLNSAGVACEGSGTLDLDHTLVREIMTQGTGAVEGISAEEISLINEWMQYDDANLSNTVGDYFCLTPEEAVQHSYTLSVMLATGNSDELASAGAGLGGAVSLPIGSIKLGCFIEVGVSGGWVRFKYRNNLGMQWHQEYGIAQVSIDAECTAEVSLGPALSSSLGTDDLCGGTADPDPYPDWLGPLDFSGLNVSQAIGVEGGAIGGVNVSGAYMVAFTTKGNVFFNTSGPCAEVGLFGGASGGVELIGGGGQAPVGSTSFEENPVSDAGAEHDMAGEGVCEPNDMNLIEEVLLVRHYYFDTGDSDPATGDHAMNNSEATRDLTAALQQALDNHTVTQVGLRVEGHASPVWASAADREEAEQENTALANSRAVETETFILGSFDQFGGDMPPVTPIISAECHEDNPSNQVDSGSSGHGDQEGIEQTNDPDNNWQRYRRATVTLTIVRLIDEIEGVGSPQAPATGTDGMGNEVCEP